MSNDSTKSALDRYYARLAKEAEPKGPKRKNQKPEFTLTVVPCMAWLASQNFSMNRIEAKAVWSEAAGRYLSGQTDVGVADAFGCCPDGTAAFIEFKAPGKRSTLKPHQREWLLGKIAYGCFAVCADSVDSLRLQWLSFEAMRQHGKHKAYLRAQLMPRRSPSESSGPDVLF